MMKTEETYTLDDGHDQDFEGVTLQIGSEDGKPKYSNVQLADASNIINGKVKSESDSAKLIQNDGSTTPITRPSTLSLVPWAGQSAKDFFSYRSDLLTSAVIECTKEFTDNDSEELVASWLLTEVSLWDQEKERLILVTKSSLYIIKYDFIALKILDNRKINLDMIESITVGDLTYPPTSLIRSRDLSGVRMQWGTPMSLMDKWNPFAKETPVLTFASHPLFWHKEGGADTTKMYNVDDLTATISQLLDKKIKNFSCHVVHRPILIENYINIASLIHNKNSLGFFKVRGKFSF